jgi:hypothetical protein
MRDQVLDEVMAEEQARRSEARSSQTRSAKTSPPAASERSASKVGVRGITGSLNAFEVEQAMNKHSAALLACVEARPRALGHVAGAIAFHIDVDGQGNAERVRVMESDIGYPVLEDCLTQVVAAAPFPVPAGAQRAETQWRMSVDPLRQPAEPLESEALEEAITRQSEAAYESCNVAKARRFSVNGYLAHGTFQPVSVRAPWRGPAAKEDAAQDPLSCLTEALGQWTRWPQQNGFSKVSFELRWVKAPPPVHARRGARTRSARTRANKAH